MTSGTSTSPRSPTRSQLSCPPRYPYSIQRIYICGHPPEILHVSKLASGRLQHTLLSSWPKGQPMRLSHTLEKCIRCASTHAGLSTLEIAANQGKPGRKRNGFEEVLERFKASGMSRMKNGKRGMGHARVEEGKEMDGGSFVFSPNVPGYTEPRHYERALRVREEDIRPLARRETTCSARSTIRSGESPVENVTRRDTGWTSEGRISSDCSQKEDPWRRVTGRNSEGVVASNHRGVLRGSGGTIGGSETSRHSGGTTEWVDSKTSKGITGSRRSASRADMMKELPKLPKE